jgi:hypothetical protein
MLLERGRLFPLSAVERAVERALRTGAGRIISGNERSEDVPMP